MIPQEVARWRKHLSRKHKDEFDLQSLQKRHRHGRPWLPSSGGAPGAKGEEGVRDKKVPEAHWPASLTYMVSSRALRDQILSQEQQ